MSYTAQTAVERICDMLDDTTREMYANPTTYTGRAMTELQAMLNHMIEANCGDDADLYGVLHESSLDIDTTTGEIDLSTDCPNLFRLLAVWAHPADTNPVAYPVKLVRSATFDTDDGTVEGADLESSMNELWARQISTKLVFWPASMLSDTANVIRVRWLAYCATLSKTTDLLATFSQPFIDHAVEMTATRLLMESERQTFPLEAHLATTRRMLRERRTFAEQPIRFPVRSNW